MATTLADHLRSLSDEALGVLLRRRPDLVVPVPADLSALAVRVQSRVSVARALDGLDEFALQILDAARLTRSPDDGTTSVDAMLALAAAPAQGADPAVVRAAITRLRDLFLLYGSDAALHIVASADEVCSPYPAGLGRPAARLNPATAALCADAAGLRRTLLSAPPAARAVLDRLAAGPPVGTVAAAGARDADDNPVRWLVTRQLLVPVAPPGQAAAGDPAPGTDGYEAVELPRELGMLLRRDSGALGVLRPHPPGIGGPPRNPAAVDAAGAGQAMEAVRQIGALLEALGADPAPVLRTGGLGVRELRRLARTAGVDEPAAALLLEAAYAAALAGEAEPPSGRGERIGPRAPGAVTLLLPTVTYDAWRAAPFAQRWADVARAWLAMPRQAGLIGQRDERDRPITVLSPDVERAAAPGNRWAVLSALADLAPGTTPTADELLELLAWQRPRRTKGREPAFREVLDEAARLGVTGLGGLTSYGRLTFAAARGEDEDSDADPLGLRSGLDEAPGPSQVARALDALLPGPVDHLLVQADLTVVVPGPPEPTLAAELELIAQHESAGGATVYRVTPESTRRALDAGYAADDLHGLFRRRSRTPVPQALTYLIDDVARRHGGLRVGGAGAYLRSDDEALLAQVLADRRLSALSLRRLAPTVLTTPYHTARLLDALRDAGYAPVPEDARGAAVLTRPKARRAPARAPVATRGDPSGRPRLSLPRVRGIVEQVRRGDAALRATRRAPVTVRVANGHGTPGLTAVQAHTQALATLQQAVRDKALVWVGYVDAHGSNASRLVRPVSIGGGYLRAEDERTDTLHTFALHRITAAVLDE